MKNNPISIKAILIALVVQVILNFLFAIFVFSSMKENNQISITLIVILFFDITLTSGFPGYLAAIIAKRNYVLHGLLIGIIASILMLRPIINEVQYPLNIGLIILALSFVTSTIGGWFRGYQISKASVNK